MIIGLTHKDEAPQERRLFSYQDNDATPDETLHKAISPYLFDASLLSDPHLVVERTRSVTAGMPAIRVGSKPVDGGYYVMDSAARSAFLQMEPNAESFIRPYVGSNEHINGGERWILCLDSVAPQILKSMPKVLDTIEQVRLWRLGELPPRKLQDDTEAADNKASPLSLTLAKTPAAFHVTVLPNQPFLAIPEVSSERRAYLPIAWLDPPTIPSNKLLIALDVELYHFGLITSRMHMVWVWHIGGRLKSDPQYSPGISYNPFPWPDLSDAVKARIGRLADSVLTARSAHPGSNLADLYDRRTMPKDLMRAHEKLDLAVDRLFRSAAFTSDRERVEHLFGLYDKAVAPLAAAARSTKPHRRRAS